MSKTPWTPGPWRATEGTDARYIRCSKLSHDGIAKIIPHQGMENIGNARLIAAAPEMAKSLYLAAAALESVIRNRPQNESAPTNLALDVIAKDIRALLSRIGAAP